MCNSYHMLFRCFGTYWTGMETQTRKLSNRAFRFLIFHLSWSRSSDLAIFSYLVSFSSCFNNWHFQDLICSVSGHEFRSLDISVARLTDSYCAYLVDYPLLDFSGRMSLNFLESSQSATGAGWIQNIFHGKIYIRQFSKRLVERFGKLSSVAPSTSMTELSVKFSNWEMEV